MVNSPGTLGMKEVSLLLIYDTFFLNCLIYFKTFKIVWTDISDIIH